MKTRHAGIFLAIALLIIGACGAYDYISTVRAKIAGLESNLFFAKKDSKDCWGQNQSMAYDRQQDFKTFSMKTDAEIKQHIFQQAILCGMLIGNGTLKDIPKTYDEYGQKCLVGWDKKSEEIKKYEEKHPLWEK